MSCLIPVTLTEKTKPTKVAAVDGYCHMPARGLMRLTSRDRGRQIKTNARPIKWLLGKSLDQLSDYAHFAQLYKPSFDPIPR